MENCKINVISKTEKDNRCVGEIRVGDKDFSITKYEYNGTRYNVKDVSSGDVMIGIAYSYNESVEICKQNL